MYGLEDTSSNNSKSDVQFSMKPSEAKKKAEQNGMKVYSKKEVADLVDKIVFDDLYFLESNSVGVLGEYLRSFDLSGINGTRRFF